jgi:hypothetical protein
MSQACLITMLASPCRRPQPRCPWPPTPTQPEIMAVLSSLYCGLSACRSPLLCAMDRWSMQANARTIQCNIANNEVIAACAKFPGCRHQHCLFYCLHYRQTTMSRHTGLQHAQDSSPDVRQSCPAQQAYTMPACPPRHVPSPAHDEGDPLNSSLRTASAIAMTAQIYSCNHYECHHW